MSLLEKTIAAVRPPSRQAAAEADARQARLTKPPGSMGLLEPVGALLAGVAGACPPPVPARPAVAVFAGDHGVHAQGVTPWPQEVTAQMVANLAAGGAVVNALARQVGASVTVVDVGVAADLPDAPNLLRHNVARGTADLSTGPAMTAEQALTALEVGIGVAHRLVDDGADLLVTGDMGIANTTPSAALVAAFTGVDAAEVTGRGTGVDDATLARKTAVVEQAVRRVERCDPLVALAEVGGLEHAALAGFLLGAAQRRVPVVLDGVIACSSALVAAALCPPAVGYWVAGHLSAEPGAGVALAHLGLDPLLDLGLRLGEGSGAVLAVPVVQAAARLLSEVATFDSAGVSGA
ncbi:MAG TPA: nicotinate-nucleotide--dimethylbenzimidazole phosphoribosyltransferase [Pedococcus sp.]